MSSEISARAQHLLKVLIDQFIIDGQPISSKVLADGSGMGLSSATVRNVMADLESHGLVMSPHTSSGRVPTALGYRFFVDTLLNVKSLESDECLSIQQQLGGERSAKDIVSSVSGLLSGITKMAGVVVMPRSIARVLRHIEFLPLSDNRVLAIFVVNEEDVQNSIIQTERSYSASELQRSANYLNQLLVGHDLMEVRSVLLAELRSTKDHMDEMMQTAVVMAEKIFTPDTDNEEVILSGETNLMGFNELSDMERLKGLFEAFNEKRKILHLFDKCIDSKGVQIFIGKESGYSVLDDCSVVTSAYHVDGEALGVLGVIGPTRMAYERVIPLVDVTAKLVSAALNHEEISP